MNVKNLMNIVGIIAEIVMLIICEHMLGCSGNGIVFISLIIYSFFFTIMMGSVKDTLTKMVSVRMHRGFFDNAKRIFCYCLIYTALASVVMCTLFVLMANRAGRLMLGDSSTEMIVAALGVFFVISAFSKTFQGYYLAFENSILYIVAVSVRCVALLVACPIMIKLFSSVGDKAASLHKNFFLVNVYGAIGVVAAMCIAELLLLIILIAGLKLVLHSDSFSFNEVRTKDGYKNFLKSFVVPAFNVLKENIFPLTTVLFTCCLFSRSSFRNNAPVQNVYTNIGAIGVPVICVIVVALLSFKEFADTYRKKLRSDYRKDEKKAVNSRFNMFLKNGITIIVPVALSVIMYAEGIARFIFGCEFEAIKGIMIWSGIIIFLNGIDLIFSKSLDALGRDSLTFMGRLAGFVCAMIVILSAEKNGAKISYIMIALFIEILIAVIIHGFFALKDVSVRINDIIAKLIKVGISSLIMIVINLILSRFLAKNLILLLVCMLIGYASYLVSFVLIRGINQKEVQGMVGSLTFYPMSLLTNIIDLK